MQCMFSGSTTQSELHRARQLALAACAQAQSQPNIPASNVVALVAFLNDAPKQAIEVVFRSLKQTIMGPDPDMAVGGIAALASCVREGDDEFHKLFDSTKWAARLSQLAANCPNGVPSLLQQRAAHTLRAWHDHLQTEALREAVDKLPLALAAAPDCLSAQQLAADNSAHRPETPGTISMRGGRYIVDNEVSIVDVVEQHLMSGVQGGCGEVRWLEATDQYGVGTESRVVIILSEDVQSHAERVAAYNATAGCSSVASMTDQWEDKGVGYLAVRAAAETLDDYLYQDPVITPAIRWSILSAISCAIFDLQSLGCQFKEPFGHGLFYRHGTGWQLAVLPSGFFKVAAAATPRRTYLPAWSKLVWDGKETGIAQLIAEGAASSLQLECFQPSSIGLVIFEMFLCSPLFGNIAAQDFHDLVVCTDMDDLPDKLDSEEECEVIATLQEAMGTCSIDESFGENLDILLNDYILACNDIMLSPLETQMSKMPKPLPMALLTPRQAGGSFTPRDSPNGSPRPFTPRAMTPRSKGTTPRSAAATPRVSTAIACARNDGPRAGTQPNPLRPSTSNLDTYQEIDVTGRPQTVVSEWAHSNWSGVDVDRDFGPDPLSPQNAQNAWTATGNPNGQIATPRQDFETVLGADSALNDDQGANMSAGSRPPPLIPLARNFPRTPRNNSPRDHLKLTPRGRIMTPRRSPRLDSPRSGRASPSVSDEELRVNVHSANATPEGEVTPGTTPGRDSPSAVAIAISATPPASITPGREPDRGAEVTGERSPSLGQLLNDVGHQVGAIHKPAPLFTSSQPDASLPSLPNARRQQLMGEDGCPLSPSRPAAAQGPPPAGPARVMTPPAPGPAAASAFAQVPRVATAPCRTASSIGKLPPPLPLIPAPPEAAAAQQVATPTMTPATPPLNAVPARLATPPPPATPPLDLAAAKLTTTPAPAPPPLKPIPARPKTPSAPAPPSQPPNDALGLSALPPLPPPPVRGATPPSRPTSGGQPPPPPPPATPPSRPPSGGQPPPLPPATPPSRPASGGQPPPLPPAAAVPKPPAPAAAAVPAPAVAKPAEKNVRVLVADRSRQVTAILAGIKLPISALVKLIVTWDPAMKLTQRHLTMLQSVIPSAEETEQLAPYAEKLVRTLAKADRYMCEISQLPQLIARLEIMGLRHNFDSNAAHVLEGAQAISNAARTLMSCQAIIGTLTQLADMSIENGIYGTLCTYDAGMLETLCMVGSPPPRASDQEVQACRAGGRHDDQQVLEIYEALSEGVRLLAEQAHTAPPGANMSMLVAKTSQVMNEMNSAVKQMQQETSAVRAVFKVGADVTVKELSALAFRFLQDFEMALVETTSPAPSPIGMSDTYLSEASNAPYLSEASNASVVVIGVRPSI